VFEREMFNPKNQKAMDKVFVKLYGHSEYMGFTVFGGVFNSVEAAINSERNLTDKTVLQRTDGDTVYVLPLYLTESKERVEQIKAEFFDPDPYFADSVCYQYGGYVVREMEVK
jgi:hypothetical protein